MVRVQSIVRALLVAAVAVSAVGVRAEDAETQTVAVDAAGAVETASVPEKTCVSPEVVANFETKIDALVTERAQWQSQLVGVNAQWKKEKSELEEQLAQEQSAQKQAKKELAQTKDEAAKTVAKLQAQLSESEAEHAQIVSTVEKKLVEIESQHAQTLEQLKTQVTAGANAQSQEKSELEEKLAQEQSAHKQAKNELAQAKDEAAKAVAKLEAQLSESATQHAQIVSKVEKQLAETENQHAKTLDELKTQVTALEQTVEELKKQVAEQKVTLGKRDAEVSETKAKLVKSQDQVKTLERDVASSRKKNEALRDELQKLDDKVTVSALLSSYYDEGVVLASNAVTALRLQVESAQQGTTGVAEALAALEAYKKTVTETTDKLYAEHLAATVDPLIADLRRASDPIVKQYQPLVEAELTRAKTTAIKNYNLAAKRFKATRADAIAALKQTEGVAPYAQQIVDGSLYVLAAPIVFVTARIVLSLVWFIISTAFCVATFGYCCGLCAKKRSKSKRKVSRKQPLSPGAPAPPSAPSSSSSKKNASSPTTNTVKRAGGKKHK